LKYFNHYFLQFYCPECNDPVECDISVGFGQCFGCNFNFCTSCLKPFHGTSDCDLDDEERKYSLKEYIAKQNAEQVLKAREKEIAEQKRKDLELKRQMRIKQESLSNSFINSSFKKCPGCKANIEVFIILMSIVLIIYTSSPKLLQIYISNSY
jgi:NMD protein affecting ribosome stability and mRNA decay